MEFEIRDASADDAPFLAWVMQEAARSHLEKGVWDLVFAGPEGPRLEILATLATTDRIHFCHWSRFRVLEVNGEPAAGLSAYEYARHGMEHLRLALVEVMSGLGWSRERMLEAGMSTASFEATGYPNPEGIWIVEWVATRPEFRGRGLIHHLLLDILDRGRREEFSTAQIGHLLGNAPARHAYRRVGFKWLQDYRHPDFEAVFGTPGLARMQRPL
jgi:GNAT superfamily N-acetyltransferase